MDCLDEVRLLINLSKPVAIDSVWTLGGHSFTSALCYEDEVAVPVL